MAVLFGSVAVVIVLILSSAVNTAESNEIFWQCAEYQTLEQTRVWFDCELTIIAQKMGFVNPKPLRLAKKQTFKHGCG
jgi:hypothetical protein